jgi:hypothetical protein
MLDPDTASPEKVLSWISQRFTVTIPAEGKGIGSKLPLLMLKKRSLNTLSFVKPVIDDYTSSPPPLVKPMDGYRDLRFVNAARRLVDL